MIREVSLIYSPIVMFYESVPIQIMSLRIYIRENRLNSAGIVQEFITISKITLEHSARITNQLRICRMQHELTEIHDDSQDFLSQ